MIKIVILIVEVLLISLGLLFICCHDKLSYWGAGLLSLAISIPDLYVIPNADLAQYFRDMDQVYQCNSISNLLETYRTNPLLIVKKSTFIYNIFQWLISKSGLYTLLPTLSILIISLCIFIPIIHQYNINKLSSLGTIFSISSLFCLFPYHEMTITVRWMLVAGIFFLITYIYCNLNKLNISKYFIFFMVYIALIFVHEAFVFPLIILLICTYFRNKVIKWYYYLGFMVCFSVLLAAIHFSGYMSSATLIGNARSYSGVSDSTKQVSLLTESGSSKLAFYTALIIPFLYSIGNLVIIKHNNMRGLKFVKKLFIMFNLADILLLPYLLIAQRYSLYVGIIDWIFYLKALKLNKQIDVNVKVIYLLGTSILFISMIYVTFKTLNFNFNEIIDYKGVANYIIAN